MSIYSYSKPKAIQEVSLEVDDAPIEVLPGDDINLFFTSPSTRSTSTFIESRWTPSSGARAVHSSCARITFGSDGNGSIVRRVQMRRNEDVEDGMRRDRRWIRHFGRDKKPLGNDGKLKGKQKLVEINSRSKDPEMSQPRSQKQRPCTPPPTPPHTPPPSPPRTPPPAPAPSPLPTPDRPGDTEVVSCNVPGYTCDQFDADRRRDRCVSSVRNRLGSLRRARFVQVVKCWSVQQ